MTASIDANAIGTTLVDGAERAPRRQRAVGIDVIDAEGAGFPGVGDVKEFFIGREGQAIGHVMFARDNSGLVGLGIVAKHEIAGLFFRLIPRQSIRWIGEPEGAVAFDDDVIGRVKFFATGLVDHGRDGAIGSGAAESAAAMFRGDQLPLQVESIAIGIARRGAENRQASGRRPGF